MSFVSSRKTYDTDSITLRRIFSYDLSNSPFSTGFVLTALTKGVVSFTTLNLALSTIGVPDLPALQSTLEGELVSTIGYFTSNLPSSASFFLPSTVAGLGTSGYVSTTYLTSTIDGLGTLGYLSSFVIGDTVTSSIIGLGSSGYVSSTQLTSTVEGLGSSDYISSSQLLSSLTGLGSLGYISSTSFASTFDTAFPSTVIGLGSAGYVSTASLWSTVDSLGTVGYISAPSLYSTVNALPSFGFVSSLTSTFRSTFSNELVGNWNTSGFLYSNLGPFSSIQTFQFDLGNQLRNQMIVSTTNLDIEFKANLQFGYYDGRSIQYDFSTCLVKGVSLNTTSIVAQENIAYYILNANPVNLPFFFTEKYRFLINDVSTISTLKSDEQYSTLSLFHIVGVSSPTTNQLFAYPAKPTSITLVLDNSTRANP
jgi:hypothetical protein